MTAIINLRRMLRRVTWWCFTIIVVYSALMLFSVALLTLIDPPRDVSQTKWLTLFLGSVPLPLIWVFLHRKQRQQRAPTSPSRPAP